MMFWSLALVVTAIASATLYYAGAGRRVNATGTVDAPLFEHFRLQLKEIETDAGLGRLGPAEVVAAKAELAREVMRAKAETATPPADDRARRLLVAGAVAATVLLAFGVYAALGRPDLPAAPLVARTDIPGAGMTLESAVARIETQLEATPDDLRGWVAIAPAYMQLGRFDDAVRALRQVIALDGPSADRETDLGEAIMLAQGGSAAGEPLELFRSASGRDPSHVRSRYYVAGELTRTGEFAAARAEWTALLALAQGDEAWVELARAGLGAAETGLSGVVPDSEAIRGMVEGLAARLAEEGGSVAEWTQLVRSRLVLDQRPEAQAAYEAARAAYPDAAARTELDVLAADNGLVAGN